MTETKLLTVIQMIHDVEQNPNKMGFDKHHLVELLRAEIHFQIFKKEKGLV
jgi:translation initiation factor 2 beta subunit (eIF-2beta)/eIF-5